MGGIGNGGFFPGKAVDTGGHFPVKGEAAKKKVKVFDPEEEGECEVIEGAVDGFVAEGEKLAVDVGEGQDEVSPRPSAGAGLYRIEMSRQLFAQALGSPAVVVAGCGMKRVNKGNGKVEPASGLQNPCGFLDQEVGVTEVLKDGNAEGGISNPGFKGERFFKVGNDIDMGKPDEIDIDKVGIELLRAAAEVENHFLGFGLEETRPVINADGGGEEFKEKLVKTGKSLEKGLKD